MSTNLDVPDTVEDAGKERTPKVIRSWELNTWA